MKAFFFDRDDTLNIDTGYISDPEDMKLYPNAVEALQHVKSLGYKIFIITNQSGMGRGLIKPAQYRGVSGKFLSLSGGYGLIDDILYCPHSPLHDCVCRKPKNLLLQIVKEQYNVDFTKSFFVGDKITDVACGKSMGLRTIRVIKNTEEAVDGHIYNDQMIEHGIVIASISEIINLIQE